MTQEL
jgi:hypothetical protein